MSVERAFIALWPGAAACRQLTSLQQALKPAMATARPRWTHAGDLHLTLRFLGDLDHDACERLLTWLADAIPAPAPLTPERIELWPDARRPRLLVLRLRAVSWLDALAGAAADAASGIGLPPDARPFAPHVTLARLQPARVALPTPPAWPPRLTFAQLGLYARDRANGTERRYRTLRARDLGHP